MGDTAKLFALVFVVAVMGSVCLAVFAVSFAFWAVAYSVDAAIGSAKRRLSRKPTPVLRTISRKTEGL